MELRVGNKFRLGRKIGGGSFGDIYQGVNIATGEEYAVCLNNPFFFSPLFFPFHFVTSQPFCCVFFQSQQIKLEAVKSKHPQLFYEYKLYKILQGGPGIPQVVWFGVEGDFNVMVMDLLGPSLEDLFLFCNQRFSLKTVLMLGDQMLRRLEFVHSRNFIHRDVKPDNFLMGCGTHSSQVYIIDFGLAKKYRDSRTHAHIPYRENKSLTGTARYVSINTHLGIEQSRRDDIESVAYVMIYFLKGSLPWQGLKADNKRMKYDRISEKKISTSVEALCHGLPAEFATFLTYCKSLHFEDKPDYSYLRKLLRNLFIKEGYKYDGIYDWTLMQMRAATVPASLSPALAAAPGAVPAAAAAAAGAPDAAATPVAGTPQPGAGVSDTAATAPATATTSTANPAGKQKAPDGEKTAAARIASMLDHPGGDQ